MREQPWAAPFLFLALGLAFASILARVLPMVFGDTTLKPLAHPPALLPVFVHLALALVLGLVHSAVPEHLVRAGCRDAGWMMR
jgi:hydrogenase-4 component F